jgi:hypothetical protein
MNNKRVESIDQIEDNSLHEREVPDNLNQLPTAGNRKMVDPVRIWWL